MGGKNKYPWGILPFYALYYMHNAVYTGYYSNYLVSTGIERSAIGSIMALSPLIAIAVQPLWGALGDRMKWKNTLLTLMATVATAVLIIGGFVNSILMACAVVCAYSFFQTSITPLMDSIALEKLRLGGYAYGPVRMTGTIAYAVTTPLIGLVMANNYRLAPFIAAGFLVLGVAASFSIPKVAGHAHGKKSKKGMFSLLKDKELLTVMLFGIVQMLGFTYYNTYISLYLEDMGASSAVIGTALFLSAASEVPFLLLGDKLFKKLGVGPLLIGSTVLTGVRMMVVGSVSSVPLLLATQVLHGTNYIVMSFAMSKYIDLRVPDELKASGHILYVVIALGLARALGAWLSGLAVDLAGLRSPFFIAAGVCFVGTLVFGIIIVRNKSLCDTGKEE